MLYLGYSLVNRKPLTTKKRVPGTAVLRTVGCDVQGIKKCPRGYLEVSGSATYHRPYQVHVGNLGRPRVPVSS